jgi:hypothetical protein
VPSVLLRDKRDFAADKRDFAAKETIVRSVAPPGHEGLAISASSDALRLTVPDDPQEYWKTDGRPQPGHGEADRLTLIPVFCCERTRSEATLAGKPRSTEKAPLGGGAEAEVNILEGRDNNNTRTLAGQAWRN